MKPLIVANWKMNPRTKEEAFDLAEKTEPCPKAETVICSPFCFLSSVGKEGLRKGAQDAFWEEEGAFTGEVSSAMLKSLSVDYVIVGHSERRKYFSESDNEVNKKALSVQKNGLTPIVCIGEKEEERDKKREILEREIKEGLKGLNHKIVLAYEPIWAIGTGTACSKEDALEARKAIVDILKENFGDEFSEIPILYGGSVKSHNAASYIKEAGFNGLLVGGASLKPEEFNKIIREAV
jgi:triosephosphate isomerase (TIM)